MKPTPDWDTLIQKHLDGLTTEEEAKALSARIVEDAEVRSRYQGRTGSRRVGG